jgi:hypothetical protein
MKSVILLLACLISLSLSVQAGELYRWVDKDGKMNYGDVPPTGATDVERIKLSGETTRNEDLPYETRRAQQNFPVTLYVSKVCGETCDQARSMLNKRGIPFSEKALETKQDVEAFKQLSGIGSAVPVLAVGKNFLRGFLESQWNSELDFAGYPKSAPYRAPRAPAANSVSPANPAAR